MIIISIIIALFYFSLFVFSFNIKLNEKSIAILLPGQLRFRDNAHLQQIKLQFTNCSIFISTYPKYYKTCYSLTKNCIFLYDNKDELDIEALKNISDLNGKFNETLTPVQSNMWQYVHLDNILKSFKHELQHKDIIFKTRPDLIVNSKFNISVHEIVYREIESYYHDNIHLSHNNSNNKINFFFDNNSYYHPNNNSNSNNINNKNNIMFCHRDFIYFSKTSYFFKTFDNFYDKVVNYYTNTSGKYIPLNYNNILNSTFGYLTLSWIDVPSFIFSGDDMNSLKKKINNNYKKLIKISNNYSNEHININNNNSLLFPPLFNISYYKLLYNDYKFEMNSNSKFGDYFSSEKHLLVHLFNNGIN